MIHPSLLLDVHEKLRAHPAPLGHIALVPRRITFVGLSQAGCPPVQFRQQSKDRPHTPMFQKMERSFKERQQARIRIQPVLRSSCHGAHVA